MDILQTTICASVLILVIVVIRALALYKLPKATFPILWCVAALRLLIPVQIQSQFSIYTVIDKLNPVRDPVAVLGIVASDPSKHLQAAEEVAETAMAAATAPSVSIWTVIWLIGMGIMAAVFAVSYIRSLRRFKLSRPVQNDTMAQLLKDHTIRRPVRIRRSSSTITPLTFGIMHPTILLPETTDWSNTEQLTYIVTHECVHIRRFDGLLKLILTAAVCAYWFNPLVWTMIILANRDIEMSCDEAVVRTLGDNVKSTYALALIGMEERKRRLSPIINHFNKNAIEERIVAIMKIKHTSILSLVLALVIVLGTVTVFATSASAAETEPAETGAVVEDDAAMTEIAIARLAENHPRVAEWLQVCYPDAVWWTYEGFKAASDQYLQGLKDNLGETVGYDGNNNPLIVTQAWIEEDAVTAAETLQKLQDGILISKSLSGNKDVGMEIDPAEVESWSSDRAIECTIGLLDGTEAHFGPYETMEEFREQVEPFCQEQLAAGNLSQEDMDEVTAFMSAAD